MTHKIKKLAKVMWLVAVMMYIGGLLALWMGGEFAKVSYMTWYVNALVLGVLAIGAKIGVLIMMKAEKM